MIFNPNTATQWATDYSICLKIYSKLWPYDGRFTPPVEDHQLDKMTVMMLEMMGIKVEPKALIQYSANNECENEYGLYM